MFQTGMPAQDFVSSLSPQLKWLRQNPQDPETNWDAFAPYTAQAMTNKLCQVFDSITAS